MDVAQSYAPSPLVAPATLQLLMARRDAPGLIRLGVQLGALAAVTAGTFVADGAALYAFVALGALVQVGHFGMLHEAAHRTAFASRAWNEVAAWSATLAQPMSPALMRAFHGAHHRHTHELAGDPELAGLPFMARWPRGLLWALTVSGLPVLFARVAWTLFAAAGLPAGAWRRVLPFVTPAQRARVRAEARALVLVHGGLVALAATALPRLGLHYAALVVAHAALSVHLTCEHRGLPTEGSVLARTRSLVAPRWWRWLLWNMPYHAEHHLHPAVPFHALPALHEALRPHLLHVAHPLTLHVQRGNECGARAT